MKELARRGVREIRRSLAERGDLLNLPRGSGQSAQPTVYFLTPDHDRPAGGIRVIYRHVDSLNSIGIQAAVLHQRPGFRCRWFDNDTEIRDVRQTRLDSHDLLVVGERNVGSLQGMGDYSHAVFNQNIFGTFDGPTEKVQSYFRSGPRPKAVLTVSEYNRQFLATAFPDVSVARIHLAIDSMFEVSEEPRENVISYMCRKSGGSQAALLRKFMEPIGLPDGWRFDPLENLSQREVVRRLQKSRIFLSFAEYEGFGLPAAEAMACGNYVIGSHGYGGREFFDPQFCSPMEAWDIIGMAQSLRSALAAENREPGWLQDRGEKAAAFVDSNYSSKAETQDLAGIYSALLAQ